MTTLKRIDLIALTVVLLVSISARAADTPPAIPETPASVDKILYAQPFVLDSAMEFLWRQERPAISSGYLLVLEVNPERGAIFLQIRKTDPQDYVRNIRVIMAGFEATYQTSS